MTDIPTRSSPTLTEHVRRLVEPFAAGRFVADWPARAATLAALADIARCSAVEDAWWSPDSAGAEAESLSVRPTRPTANGLRVAGTDPLSLNVDLARLDGAAHELVANATVGLESAEKIVISAAAWSLCELANPPELVPVLVNLVYEEALHLEAIGRLLGTDHAAAEWIPEDRRTNWDLVRACETPLDYMVVEHCLYEGRGTVASSAGAFQIERAGAPLPVVQVFTAIARQEANHNVTGFRWLKLLDTGTGQHHHRLAELTRRFLAAEPLPEPDGSARSLRKHFPLYLIDLYRRTSDFYLVRRAIVSASRSARRTGVPDVPAADLYRSATDTAAWAGRLEAPR